MEQILYSCQQNLHLRKREKGTIFSPYSLVNGKKCPKCQQVNLTVLQLCSLCWECCSWCQEYGQSSWGQPRSHCAGCWELCGTKAVPCVTLAA